MNERLGQPITFLLVGMGGYALNLAAFAAFLTLGVRYLAASLLAYFLSNAAMYVGNRYLTFRLSHKGFWRAYRRYVVAGSVVAGLSALILAALVEGAGADARLGQALSLAAVTPVAFLLSKRWAFRPRPA